MSKQGDKELRNVVKNFKNKELRSLLSYAKRNNTGKKSLLLERVNEMIEAGCTTSLVFKINEINAKRSSPKSLTKKTFLDNRVRALEESSKSTSSHSSFDGSKIQRRGNERVSDAEDSNFSFQECPHVKFVSLPFYEQMEVLVKPVTLRTSSHFGTSNCAQYQFRLSSQQANCITESQELINDCMIEYKVQILMRFCSNLQNIEQEDNLPSTLYVSVNGKAISLPILSSQIHSGSDVKRPARPLDITHACDLTAEVPNMISIAWNHNIVLSHCFTVVISRKLNSSDLLEKLKKNSVQKPEHTKSLIKDKLSADVDNEISTTSLKISLLCPLGKIRMTVPTRSLDCSHLQCFDAETFLQMNEKKPTWICPICDKPSKFETLVIDGLFSGILSVIDDVNEVQFFEDGSWKPLTCKKEIFSQPDDGVVCIDAPDSPCSSGSADTIVLGDSKGKQGKTERIVMKKKIAMIDLTADSDDDDDEDERSLPIIDRMIGLGSSLSPINHIPFLSNFMQDSSESDIGDK